MNGMEEMYKDFMHYGTVISAMDYDFPNDKKIITMKVAELNGVRALFILVNGEVKSTEYLGVN